MDGLDRCKGNQAAADRWGGAPARRRHGHRHRARQRQTFLQNRALEFEINIPDEGGAYPELVHVLGSV